MSLSLRPLSLGETLDRAIQILRSNFGLFASIAVLPGLAQLINALSLQFAQRSGGPVWARVVAYAFAGLFWVADLILYSLALAALCRAASERLFDRPATLSSAIAPFRERKGRLSV